ncbi:MAG: 3-oxoacyl-ACP synthase III family protein [Sphingomonadaceae bacterium]
MDCYLHERGDVTGEREAQMPWTHSRTVSVLGTGHALPSSPIETDTLIEMMVRRFGFARARQAQSIAKRMEIATRHHCRDFSVAHEPAREGDSNADLAARAVSAALADAGLAITDIAYLIGHTTTPTQPLPANIALVADRLGYSGPHVELRQACTGFANGLMIAAGLLAQGDSRPVVIVGSETGAVFFDPLRMNDDPGQIINMIQMGDGAGAVVLGSARGACASIDAAWMGSIGLNRSPGIQQHHGRSEFDHDFSQILKTGPDLFDAGVAVAALLGHGLASADIIIPHQVSGRIGDQAAAHLGVHRDRIFVSADRVGNTGSAAIWIALDQVRRSGLASGARVLTLGAEATKFLYGGFVYVHR